MTKELDNKIALAAGLEGTFNEPWMENLNQQLLIRYWKKKGMVKPLLVNVYGMIIRMTATPFGIIETVERSPTYTEYLTPISELKLEEPYPDRGESNNYE